jgi:hypothetical protein
VTDRGRERTEGDGGETDHLRVLQIVGEEEDEELVFPQEHRVLDDVLCGLVCVCVRERECVCVFVNVNLLCVC